MTQLIYKYAKCYECGKEGFQWGMVVEHTFMCHDCIKTALIKLEDLIEEAKNKTSNTGTYKDTLRLKVA